MVIHVVCFFIFQNQNRSRNPHMLVVLSSLQRIIRFKLGLMKSCSTPRWIHIMLAMFCGCSFSSCFSYTRMKSAKEACGTVDLKGWIEVLFLFCFFFLQSLLKESPFWGLWAHWIAKISGLPFYSLYFEISSLGVNHKLYPTFYFLFCVAVSFIYAYHFIRCNAEPESIFAASQISIFLYFVNVDFDGWLKSRLPLWEKLKDGCMVIQRRVRLLTSAFSLRIAPKEVCKYVLSNCLCPTTTPHFQHAIAETSGLNCSAEIISEQTVGLS